MERFSNVLNKGGRVRAAMARIDAIAFSPTEVLEEHDITIGRARELVEKFVVTWVNIIEPSGRTLEELETLFGFHPLALEDSVNQDLIPKIETYDDVVFIIARTIVWAEEIETDQLSMFLSRKFVVTIHDKVFPQLEDVRIRIRKKMPKILKSGADYLCYNILDVIVDSYFPHLDRFQDILDRLEDDIVQSPTGAGIAKIHDLRVDLTLIRNALRPQRDVLGNLARMDIPVFKKETRNYLRDVQDHMIRVLDTLDIYRELTTSLMEVQATLSSIKLNQIIKTLTVIFTVTIPATIVTSAFGMNVVFPGERAVEGLYLALLVMTIPTLLLLLLLRRKGWL
jgi:magnesium transporter